MVHHLRAKRASRHIPKLDMLGCPLSRRAIRQYSLWAVKRGLPFEADARCYRRHAAANSARQHTLRTQ
eukprot:6179649-Pleurochrysis_carterae.AAC.3